MKIYIGFKENKKPEILESETKPVKETHPQYTFIHGPFESAEKSQKYMNAMRYSLSELAIGCSLVIIFLLAMIVGWIFYSIFCV